MTIEILPGGKVTANQVLAKAMDDIEAEDSLIVVVFRKNDASVLLHYSSIMPSELALASVELAEAARQHARKP
jgi:hypothetical protein